MLTCELIGNVMISMKPSFTRCCKEKEANEEAVKKEKKQIGNLLFCR